MGNVALAIFLVLFGIMKVSNLTVVWMDPIMGFAALIAGILIFLGAIKGNVPK